MVVSVCVCVCNRLGLSDGPRNKNPRNMRNGESPISTECFDDNNSNADSVGILIDKLLVIQYQLDEKRSKKAGMLMQRIGCTPHTRTQIHIYMLCYLLIFTQHKFALILFLVKHKVDHHK